MAKEIKVLIVENSEDDAFLTLDQLRRAGYAPVSKMVDNGADLKAALAGESWDLVLSDFNLPGFSGLKALEICKSAAPEIPFVLLSGSVGEETVAEVMREGANDYVMKDRPARLGPAVERELAEAVARRERTQEERDLRLQNADLLRLNQELREKLESVSQSLAKNSK
jgi:phosphoserine phosphatase RsbU/P